MTRVSRRESGGLQIKRLHFGEILKGRAAVAAGRATRYLGTD